MAQLGADPERARRAAGRSCGSCSLCCTVLRVDELAKPAGRDCIQQRADGGCAIHATRPTICRAYHCLWLQGGLEEDERPDRIGAVVDLEATGVGVRLSIREARPGSFDASPALQAIAERHRSSMPVRITDTGDVADPDRPFRVLLADGVEQRVAGLRVETWRAGKRIATDELGWAERIARRIAIAWRSLARRRRGGDLGSDSQLR